MTIKKEKSLLDKIKQGVHTGVAKALLEHKRANRSIVIWQDGKIVTVPPEEIDVSDEFIKD